MIKELTLRELNVTDGPFKYTPLSARWKRYGEALQSQAMSPSDRKQFAQHALFQDLLPPVFKDMVQDVYSKTGQIQGQLFPGLAVESIINKHDACEQSETFRRNVLANLQSRIPVEAAFTEALKSTMESGITQAYTRLVVFCIQADEQQRSQTLRANHSDSFGHLEASVFCDAALSTKTPVLQKVLGLDQGPPL